jgi:hypothetical protein
MNAVTDSSITSRNADLFVSSYGEIIEKIGVNSTEAD